VSTQTGDGGGARHRRRVFSRSLQRQTCASLVLMDAGRLSRQPPCSWLCWAPCWLACTCCTCCGSSCGCVPLHGHLLLATPPSSHRSSFPAAELHRDTHLQAGGAVPVRPALVSSHTNVPHTPARQQRAHTTTRAGWCCSPRPSASVRVCCMRSRSLTRSASCFITPCSTATSTPWRTCTRQVSGAVGIVHHFHQPPSLCTRRLCSDVDCTPRLRGRRTAQRCHG